MNRRSLLGLIGLSPVVAAAPRMVAGVDIQRDGVAIVIAPIAADARRLAYRAIASRHRFFLPESRGA